MVNLTDLTTGVGAKILTGGPNQVREKFLLDAATLLAQDQSDIIWLSNEDDKVPGIEKIREAVGRMRLTPNTQKRVMVIPRVDQLSERSTQVLLKILEDIPKNAWFLLGAEKDGVLAPTLRSRAVIFKLTEEHLDFMRLGEIDEKDQEKIKAAYQKLLVLCASPAPWSRKTLQDIALDLDTKNAGAMVLNILLRSAQAAEKINSPLGKEKIAYERYVQNIGNIKKIGQADRLMRQILTETRLYGLDKKQSVIRLLLCLELPLYNK